MVSWGERRIDGIYWGVNEIWRVYFGESLVFYKGLYPKEKLVPSEELFPDFLSVH